MTDESDVRRIALSLPETTGEGLGYSVKDKGFVWPYLERVEGRKGRVPTTDRIGIRVANLEEKEMLLASASEKFFTTDHYNGYPAVCVHLSAIEVDELAELLTDAWRCRAPKKLVAEFDARNPR